jgi:transcriptional regulator with XRE-family HTH domain
MARGRAPALGLLSSWKGSAVGYISALGPAVFARVCFSFLSRFVKSLVKNNYVSRQKSLKIKVPAFGGKVFGAQLWRLMHERRISQVDLAAGSGVAQTKLSRYLRGVNEPRLDDLAALCAYFNVSADFFLDRMVPPVPRSRPRPVHFSAREQQMIYALIEKVEVELSGMDEEKQRIDYLRSWIQLIDQIAKSRR